MQDSTTLVTMCVRLVQQKAVQLVTILQATALLARQTTNWHRLPLVLVQLESGLQMMGYVQHALRTAKHVLIWQALALFVVMLVFQFRMAYAFAHQLLMWMMLGDVLLCNSALMASITMVKITVNSAMPGALIVLLQLYALIAPQTTFYRMHNVFVQLEHTTKVVFVPL